MAENTKQILSKILEIIGFTDDKDAFISEFVQKIEIKSALTLIDTLNEEEKKDLKEKLSRNENINQIISRFSEKDRNKTLHDTSKDALIKYVESINPLLSPQKANTLNSYFMSISKPSSKQL